MDTFHITMESPRGKEVMFTGVYGSFAEAEEMANREYPRHTLVEIENATTGETKEFQHE